MATHDESPQCHIHPMCRPTQTPNISASTVDFMTNKLFSVLFDPFLQSNRTDTSPKWDIKGGFWNRMGPKEQDLVTFDT